jgi:catechol 2,3-dioxygenase-like lactoylglutathione lyase family enzyme
MKLLRAATLTVPDCKAAAARYARWFDYAIVDSGLVPDDLAASWGAPASAGREYVVARPASGAEVFLRFVDGDPAPDYRPLRTFGWAAIEICVQDVLAVNARMAESPFEIIGPPKKLEGLPTIFPMQVKGPDQEIVFLTEINGDPPDQVLPRAASLIDKLFILVLACSDLRASTRWFAEHLRLDPGRELDLVYSVINGAFDLPPDTQHTLLTMTHDRDVFLELDQYPDQTTPRAASPGALAPGIAMATFIHPDLAAAPGPWIAPPVVREGPLYGGRRAACMRAPDGTLVEVVEA